MALAYLLAIDEISFDSTDKLFIGELSLDGSLKKVSGILSLVQAAASSGYKQVYVPHANAQEAALVSGIEIYPVTDLWLLIKHLNTKEKEPRYIHCLLYTSPSPRD